MANSFRPFTARTSSRSKMSQPILLLLAAVSLCVLSPCAAAGKPLVTAVTKDASTSLYTAPLKANRPLVLDLSAAAITLSTSCQTPVTLSASSTDGRNPLAPVSFPATASCAPGSSPGAGAVGVAGLGRSKLSLPAQVAATQKVANKFMLCLPTSGNTGTSGNGVGVAIFGGGPFFLSPDRPDIVETNVAGEAPLKAVTGSSGYFVSATGIAVDGQSVALGQAGPLVVGLSTMIPFTALRADVYRPFVNAFNKAMGQTARLPTAVAPFELCYDSTKLQQSLSGYFVPNVDLLLAGGQNFTIVGGNSMVQVRTTTACFAFVQMKAGGSSGPAVVIGGFQMENRLVVLDEEKQKFSFTGFLGSGGYSCSNFNFTMAA